MSGNLKPNMQLETLRSLLANLDDETIEAAVERYPDIANYEQTPKIALYYMRLYLWSEIPAKSIDVRV